MVSVLSPGVYRDPAKIYLMENEMAHPMVYQTLRVLKPRMRAFGPKPRIRVRAGEELVY